MGIYLKIAAIGLLCSLCTAIGAAEEITKEQVKALDDQVQEIKKEALDISAGVMQLEEKLIYPPNAQISIYLAIAQKDARQDKFRLDAVNVKIDGKVAARQIYSPQESEALLQGGMQRLYTGNIRTGQHTLEAELIGKSSGNNAYRKNSVYKFTKEPGAKILKITLAGPDSANEGITFND